MLRGKLPLHNNKMSFFRLPKLVLHTPSNAPATNVNFGAHALSLSEKHVPKTQLEINKENMNNKILNIPSNPGTVPLCATKFEETIIREKEYSSPGGFGQR